MSNKLVHYKDVCAALIPMIADMMQKGNIEPAIDTLKALGALEDVDPAKVLQEYCDTQPERIKGHWVEIASSNHTYKCSVCGRLLVNITDGKNNVAKNYPYCHCGADMRGEQDE